MRLYIIYRNIIILDQRCEGDWQEHFLSARMINAILGVILAVAVLAFAGRVVTVVGEPWRKMLLLGVQR